MDEGPLDNLLMVIIGAIALNAMRYDPVPFGDAATLAFAGLPALMIGLGLFNLARAVLKRPRASLKAACEELSKAIAIIESAKANQLAFVRSDRRSIHARKPILGACTRGTTGPTTGC